MNIVPDVSTVQIFYQFAFLWYRSRVMYQQNVILISALNIVLVMENVKNYGERRCQNETVKL